MYRNLFGKVVKEANEKTSFNSPIASDIKTKVTPDSEQKLNVIAFLDQFFRHSATVGTAHRRILCLTNN
jgi:hypothetical protein